MKAVSPRSTGSMELSKPLEMSETPLVDFDAVCRKIRAAIEPTRAQAISLHDRNGDLLWLSESSMGPDEHNVVRDALEAFAQPGSLAVATYDLGDARSAVVFRVANAERLTVGAAMLIIDARVIKEGSKDVGLLMTPKLLRALGYLSVMLRPAPAQKTPPSHASAAAHKAAPAFKAAPANKAVPPASPARPAHAAAPPVAPNPQRTAELVTPQLDRLNAALLQSPIVLYVQRLVPLTKTNKLRRYEVLLRSKSDDAPNSAPQAMLKAAVENGLGSMIDRRVTTTLIRWLIRHRGAWQPDSKTFSINLTKTALHDEHFLRFVRLCLEKAALPKGTLSFEIDVPSAVKLGAKIVDVAQGFDRLGCPLILDDFALRTECFALLRMPGVRFIKLAPEITSRMRTDKLSQAAITGLVQMSRVLGMHTVAKRSESAAEHEWLTALGVDFVQSNALSPAGPIESLSE